MSFGNLAPGGGIGAQGMQLLQQVQKMKAQPGGGMNTGLLARLLPQAGGAAPGGAAAGTAAVAGAPGAPAPAGPAGMSGMPAFMSQGLLAKLFGGMQGGLGGMMGGNTGGVGAPMDITPPNGFGGMPPVI